MDLAKRQNTVCYDTWGNIYNCDSAWYSWGRWVTLVIVLIGIVILFFLLSCLSARRRRRRGLRPFYGTGWTGQTPWGHGPAQYNPNYTYQQHQYNQPPPQQYTQHGGYYGGPPSYYQSSQPTGDSNRGYYGVRPQQENQDFEMQSPQRVYESQAPEVLGAKK